MGHTFGLEHAGGLYVIPELKERGTPVDTVVWSEYYDWTCPMGGMVNIAKALRVCYNAPHQWALGWQALRQADGSVLTPGATVVATLPPQHASPSAGLRVVPDWAPGALPLYLSYRVRQAQDGELWEEYTEAVVIYQMDGKFQSAYMEGLDQGGVWATSGSARVVPAQEYRYGSWAVPHSGLVVRVLRSGEPGGATVSVCRPAGPETAASCAAGRDNDCNGMAGVGDTACRRFMKGRWPPRALPPPPQARLQAGWLCLPTEG